MSSLLLATTKRILREPLLHFVLLGAGFFIVYGSIPRAGRGGAPGTIVVTAGRVEHLAAGFLKTRQRPPTDAELEGLIDDWVREEIATREAMALGLDKDDAVIRRRLRQKLEFVSDDIAAQAEPSDAELNAYLHAHAESFRLEPRITFRQVYLDPVKHGEHLSSDAARLLARLERAGAKADISELSDSLLLENTFESAPAGEIAKQFGESFAVTLAGLPLARWQGPIESGYGAHLVLVSERVEGRLPTLEEAREAARREWANDRRLEENEKFYQALLAGYSVTIEGLDQARGARRQVPAR